MTWEFGKTDGRVFEIINRNSERKASYGGYEMFGSDARIGDAEDAYLKAWETAVAICEAADVFPTKIKMIVHLPCCEGGTSVVPVISHDIVDGKMVPRQIGVERLEPKTSPDAAMTIGWRVDLTAEEEDRVGNAYKEYKLCSAKEEEE